MDNNSGNALVAVFFLILPLSVAMGITGLFGGALSSYFPEISYWKGFWYFYLIARGGWGGAKQRTDVNFSVLSCTHI